MVATSTPHHPEEGRSRRPSLVRVSVPPPPPPRPFQAWLDGFRGRGLLPPVAQLVSVLDDLLLAHQEFGTGTELQIDAEGRGRGRAPSLNQIREWLHAGLGDDRPAVAHAFLWRLEDAPPLDPPLLSAWLKECFGPPATREEVNDSWPPSEPPQRSAPPSALALDLAAPTADLDGPHDTAVDVEAEVLPEPLPPSVPPTPAPRFPSLPPLAVDLAAPTADLISDDLPTLRPITSPALITGEEGPLPVPEPVVDEADIPTDPPIRARGGSIARAVPPAAPPVLEPLPENADFDRDGRPVVRHVQPRDRPVSLAMAPAARKSAQPVVGGESIILPAERRGSPWWLLLLAVLAGAIYALFFR
ncbi:MAG: hypothetical protein IPG45_19575 [Deltaproteobacteria bacterium]|nr:hypothetical protein [Deltaproteobacteria bacterium]